MFRILANWALSALSIFVVAKYLPGFEVADLTTAFVIALVLGVINATIKPVLKILTFPITIVTLGLFSFVINAALIWIVAYFIQGFSIQGFAPALYGAIILWLINTIVNFARFPVRAT